MRLIDADSVDIKKWFVVPADIQRIQAMLDEAETVSGITLRELLESTQGSTDCVIWRGNMVVAIGKARHLQHDQDTLMLLDYKVHFANKVYGGALNIDLEGE